MYRYHVGTTARIHNTHVVDHDLNGRRVVLLNYDCGRWIVRIFDGDDGLPRPQNGLPLHALNSPKLDISIFIGPLGMDDPDIGINRRGSCKPFTGKRALNKTDIFIVLH